MAVSDTLKNIIAGRSSGGNFVSTGGGGGGGGGRTLRGATPRDYNSASGGVPGVTSPTSTITDNLGDINSIINSITSNQSSALRDQYPDEYFGVLGTLLGNTQRRASGDISDLLPELQQGAAEAAVAGGLSGSGAANSKLLRDIGLTRYGVENQALRDLSTIQGQIPTVRPFDPSDIIRQQVDAQERADMYASAPSPEAAYQRALMAAGGSGGGGGRPRGGGVTYAPSGGGSTGWKESFDPFMRGYPSIAPQQGTAMNPFGGDVGLPAAPYGSIDYSRGNLPGSYWGGGEDDFSDILSLWDDTDFGGGLDYGGGASWQPFGDLGYGNEDFSLSSGDEFLSNDYGPANYDDFFDYYT